MGRIICIANQKGGGGKTTTVINLGASLAADGKSTLFADCDPQANTTGGLGFQKDPTRRTIYNALILNETPERITIKTQVKGLDLIPSDKNLVGAPVELVDVEGREFKLKSFLLSIRDAYEYILIDCPPALNLLTLNGLCAARAVMIPMQCEYYALEGLSDLVNTVKKVRANLNPGLEIEGLLRTMFDPRNILAQQVSDQLQEHFGDKLYRTVIPRNVRLAEAPSFGIPALYHDKLSKGTQAYLALAGEMLNRHGPGIGMIQQEPEQGLEV